MFKTLQTYLPIGIIALVAALMALTTQHGHMHDTMSGLMGYFLVILAMFKFFDLRGFVSAFKKYDVLAQKSTYYGYTYPFLELSLGLSYLSGITPLLINFLTFMLMVLSAYSVIKALFSRLTVTCACLGTALNLPLGTVAIVENIGMGLMALVNLQRMFL